MRAAFMCGALLSACSFHPGASGGGGSSDAAVADGAQMDTSTTTGDGGGPGNGFEKKITVKGAQVAGDVTGFPVWIQLSGDADLTAHARADGSDIYFTDVGGTAVPFELITWDKASGTLDAWVRVAHLAPNPGTPNPNEIHLRYGGGAAPLASDGSAVFNNNFAAVWHLDAAGASIPDATGTVPGMLVGAATSVAGQVGNGLSFSGLTNAITFTNPILGGGSSTISAWVYEATPVTGTFTYSVAVLGTAQADRARWFYSRYGSHMDSIAAGLYSDDHLPGTAFVLPTTTWKKVDWVYDTSGHKSHLYVDGTEVGAGASLGNAATTGTTGMLANAPVDYQMYGNTAFNGVLDEVRISKTARSSNWLRVEYANQSDPSMFYDVSAETAL